MKTGTKQISSLKNASFYSMIFDEIAEDTAPRLSEALRDTTADSLCSEFVDCLERFETAQKPNEEDAAASAVTKVIFYYYDSHYDHSAKVKKFGKF